MRRNTSHINFNVKVNILEQSSLASVGQIKDSIVSRCTVQLWTWNSILVYNLWTIFCTFQHI